MRLGLTLGSFTWQGGAPALGDTLARVARTADDAGFRSIAVMDHYFQIRMNGPAEQEMLEGYAALAFIAAHTARAELATMVTGVHYRHPGLLVKIVTTLDVLSGGRAALGIGAAWNEKRASASAFPSRRCRSGSSGSRRPCRSPGRCGLATRHHSKVATTNSSAR